MGDDAWRPLRPRRLAICARPGGPAWRQNGTLNPKAKSDDALRAVEILGRIDRRRAFANFKVKLRRRDVAGLAGMRNHVATFDVVAALNQDIAGMRVSGDETVGVAHQHEIAVALEFVAGIGDDAVFGGLDRRAFGNREIDP